MGRAFSDPRPLQQDGEAARLGRDQQVEALLSDITRYRCTNADTLRAVKVKQAAAIERRGDHHRALDALDPIIKDPAAPPESLAEAWLTVGQAKLALRDYKDALLAFLHVPVYTPDRVLLMPPAMLGSAGAYLGLDDGQRAQAALQEMMTAYPNSPEAAEAKDRLQKLAARQPKPANG